ncbi:MAG: immunoglobulin domain-containing protein [Paludibacteraceae bacterium]|nr:immunoglobulin domain-containing protein [Paludibacteraceae bacterium]
MRKILLTLLTTLLCSVTAWGVEITINRFAGSGATIWPFNTTTMLLQDEVDFVYNKGENASFSSGGLSVAASSTTTISAHGKTITGMTIVFNSANNSSTVNTGTITGWTNSNKTMAWSGSATSITITSGVATRINSAVITYTDASPLSDISSTTLSSFSRIYQSNSIAIVGLSKSPSAPGVNISGAFDSNTRLNYNNEENATSTNAIRIVSPRAISSIVYIWSTAPTTTAVSSGSYNAETFTWTAPNENTTSVDLYNQGTAKAVLSNIVVNFVGGGSCTDVGISTQPTSPVAAIVGSASSITGLVASGTSPSYQWYTCNSDGSGAAAISAAGAMSFTGYTTATLGLTPTAAGTTYYKCVVSGECGDPVTSNVVTVNAATAYTLTWDLAGGKVTTAGTGAAVDATGTPSIALVAGAAITTPVVAKDYHTFDSWSPSTPTSTMPSGNTTYTAQWTPLYASGTYTFENNASAGTAPNKLTMTDGTKVSVAAGSRVDNLFFSAQDIKYESGVYGGDGDDFKGWKINTNGATISFLVENDCDVTFGVGNLTSGATVSYTNQSGTPVDNSALTAKTDNTFSVKGGTVVTFKTSGGSTVTLKKIAITAACTSHSVTAATGTGDNSRGTVSAASATVCEGSTTTVTASPASGYQVTNWAVSDGDNGASISPTGASSSTSTTLTMGTANATVTVTFGCVAPTSPSISGTTAYTAGQDIELTASATGISASATYTWYKGTTWDDASATSSIHSGATLSINDCVEGDAGTYWCEISNGTGCNAHASKTITVGAACTDPELTITLN